MVNSGEIHILYVSGLKIESKAFLYCCLRASTNIHMVLYFQPVCRFNFGRTSLLITCLYINVSCFYVLLYVLGIHWLYLQVCSEESMMEILQRYLVYNSHANSYTWKYNGKNLDINQTLQVGNSTKHWKDVFCNREADWSQIWQ